MTYPESRNSFQLFGRAGGLMLVLGLLLPPTYAQDVAPYDDLPPYIQRITHFGERADWSLDGRKILFLTKTYGDAYEYDLETGIVTPVTHHFHHAGFVRALYLANGDILLSGARTFDPGNPRRARHLDPELWVLSKELDGPPISLGVKCAEGPAVSRTRMRIAWTYGHRQYPEEFEDLHKVMDIADIVYEDGVPSLANRRRIFDNRDYYAFLRPETQNFVPGDEDWLTFAGYRYRGTEVMMLNHRTGEIKNMSNIDVQYDEPEGIFPDGKYTTVECDRHNWKGMRHIDIWKLTLDGSGDYERLTYFNNYDGYKASNPVVRDDGRYMAFQFARTADLAGVGRGLFIYDFVKEKELFPGTWITLRTGGEPNIRHENGFVELDGKFYLLGGRRIQPVDIFDPENQTWTEGSPPPIELHHFQAFAHDGNIWVMGAMSGRFPNEVPVPNIYYYTPATDSWSVGPGIPEGRRRGAAGVVMVDGIIYMSGGIVDGHNSGTQTWLDSFDPRTGEWRRLPDAPHLRDHFNLAAHKGKLYAVGGRVTSRATGQVFQLTTEEVDVYDIASGTWTTLPPEKNLPTPRAGNSVMVYNDQIFVIGGESGTQRVAHFEVEALDPVTHEWRAYSFMNQGRHGTQAIVYNNRVYMAGGCGNRGGNPELPTIEVFSLD